MAEMVAKISMQQKIAELERRIVELERQITPATCLTMTAVQTGAWTRMWKAFDELFD